MTQELLGDLLLFTKHKSSKSVSAAARGLLNLFRETAPQLLPRAFLGKEAALQLQRGHVSLPVFGALSHSTTLDLLPQLEALKKQSKQQLQQLLLQQQQQQQGEETDGGDSDTEETDGDSEADSDSEAAADSETEAATDTEADAAAAADAEAAAAAADTEAETDSEKGDTEDGGTSTDEETEHEPDPQQQQQQQQQQEDPAEALDTAAAAAAAAAAPMGGERLLSDADFAALKLLRAKQLAQQIRGGPRRGGGPQVDLERDQKLLKLLGAGSSSSSSSSSSEDGDSEEETEGTGEGFVSERDLEGLAGRKRRRARERERDREEKLLKKRHLGNKKVSPKETDTSRASKPQRVKNRSKPLLMVQQSRRLREKKQLSVQEKAANLKRKIKNLKKSQVGKPRRRKR
ncbi:F3f19.18, related, related [Eimeria tenella]|uniref:Protein SDA1 n=1 Tax=Eimeria tenella TaxID=5802 RepID=U6L070_EIMTE|nr:F3f19.18, related, related [Eimeria tenella]CDJ42578.1 F3f19.18, related, related [Eimeria tenella]|eukprot:XP_013233328.1 F3f19.18, related, related [Eimeria tenella]